MSQEAVFQITGNSAENAGSTLKSYVKVNCHFSKTPNQTAIVEANASPADAQHGVKGRKHNALNN